MSKTRSELAGTLALAVKSAVPTGYAVVGIYTCNWQLYSEWRMYYAPLGSPLPSGLGTVEEGYRRIDFSTDHRPDLEEFFSKTPVGWIEADFSILGFG